MCQLAMYIVPFQLKCQFVGFKGNWLWGEGIGFGFNCKFAFKFNFKVKGIRCAHWAAAQSAFIA